MYCRLIINCCICTNYLTTFYHYFEFIILSFHWIPRCTCKLVDWKHCDFKFPKKVYSFLVRVVYRWICLPCVLVLCLFAVLVDFKFRLEGKTFVLITTVPDHCYFFSYSQALFVILFVYLFNKFCISSFMLTIFFELPWCIFKTGSSVK